MAAAVAVSSSPTSWPVGPALSGDGGFEFRRLPAAAMLTADELFSDGKLVPLRTQLPTPPPSPPPPIRSSEPESDPLTPSSPRAVRCTSRWLHLFTLKKPHSNPNPNLNPNPLRPRSLKHRLLHRSPRPDPDSSTTSASSRSSYSSSSSSGSECDKIIRPGPVRLSRTRTEPPPARSNRAGLSQLDSPRMSASGKVVFRGLERSSSSPGSFAPRPRARGMERSYSANVRVDPVLNVPVWPQLFASPQRKEKEKQKEAGLVVGFARTGSKGRSEKTTSLRD